MSDLQSSNPWQQKNAWPITCVEMVPEKRRSPCFHCVEARTWEELTFSCKAESQVCLEHLPLKFPSGATSSAALKKGISFSFLFQPLTWHASNNHANHHQDRHSFCCVVQVQIHRRSFPSENPTICGHSNQSLTSPLQLSTSTSRDWNPKTSSTPLCIHPIAALKIGRKNKWWDFSLSHGRIFSLLGFYP